MTHLTTAEDRVIYHNPVDFLVVICLISLVHCCKALSRRAWTHLQDGLFHTYTEAFSIDTLPSIAN